MSAKLATPRTSDELRAMDRARAERYRERHREQLREQAAARRAEEPEAGRARIEKWKAAHPGRQQELKAKWLADPENLARAKAKARARYVRLRDKIKAASKARYQADRDAIYRKARERLARKRATPEGREREQAKHNALVRAWREEHPERAREHVRRRRGHRHAAAGSHSVEQWLARVAVHGWRCRYCRDELTCKTLTLDHAIPLSRGGSEWPANLVPACLSCNSRKHDQTLPEFLRG